MALFTSVQPSIRARVLPRFPAQVLAGNGMLITKSGGKYIFEVKAFADVPLSALQDMPPNTLAGRDGPDEGPPGVITVGGGIAFTGGGGIELSANQRARSAVVAFAPPTAGAFQDFVVPLSCTITQVTMLGDPSGSAVLDLRKATFANYPPNAGNSICATAKPTIVAGIKYQDNVLTGWNKSVLAGDIVRLVVESTSGFTRLSLSVDVETL
jgi:hypothetical protein